MTLAALLTLLSQATAPLVSLLEIIRMRSPDLTPKVDEILAALNSTVDPASLAPEIKAELLNIAKGKIVPKDHPSDAV